MNVYKLGNKVKCIVRSFSAGKIGDIVMKYDNQPYTVLSDVEAQLNFRGRNKNASVFQNELNYNIDYADSLKISNVKLTDRILNLIFSHFDYSLCHISENYNAEKGQFYLNFPPSIQEVYQLFVYNDQGELVKAEGSWDQNKIIIEEDRNKEQSNYMVFYSYPGKGYGLNKENNLYVTLDLEIEGNKEDFQDQLDSTTTYWLHFDKCAIEANKDLYFRGNINTIDLTFKILHSDEDYITLQ